MKYSFFSVIILLMFTGCKTNKPKTISEYQTEFIDYLFQDYKGEKPSASFIVIRDGEIVTCQSFGYANLEKGIKANCNTNYRLGSVTKQFTAMAVMILIKQGKLSYDNKLSDVFPDFPEYAKAITIRHLLTHRSGLVSYFNLYPEDATKQIVDKEVLELLKKQDSTLFQPGKKFDYSNSGYAVLAQVVEKRSGKTFKAFLEEAIFKPLKMNQSTAYGVNENIANRAYGYKSKDSVYQLHDQSARSAVLGDGGIYSSLADYYKWDQALYSEKLVAQKTLEDAFSNWGENGKDQEKGYGYGWRMEYRNGVKYLHHGGASAGFKNYGVRIPSANISVMIFTNNGDYGPYKSKRKATFLAGLFSKGKLSIPVATLIEKSINENGLTHIERRIEDQKLNGLKYDEIKKEDFFGLGFEFLDDDEHEKAFKTFDYLKTKFPNFFGGYYGLARYHRIKNEKEKAIEYFEKGLELATSDYQFSINKSKKMLKELRQ